MSDTQTTQASSIFQELKSIPVQGLTKKKGNLDYLPWSTAWRMVAERYPQASYEYKLFARPDGSVTDVMYYPDGTGAVLCTVTIEGIARTVIYDISKHGGGAAAIKNPNAQQINKARQRALVKCLAMHGFGMAVYERCDDYVDDDETDESEAREKLARYDDLRAFAQAKHDENAQLVQTVRSLQATISELQSRAENGPPAALPGEPIAPSDRWIPSPSKA